MKYAKLILMLAILVSAAAVAGEGGAAVICTL